MFDRLVVTGANGFLANELFKELGAHGFDHHILAVTRNCNLNLEKYGIKDYSLASTTSIASGTESLKKDDLILNCAFPRNADPYKLAPGLEYIDTVFQRASWANVRGLINISSQSVYDPLRAHPANEDSPLVLESPYAVAKFHTEVILEKNCRHIPHTNIRLASLIGPQLSSRVLNKFIASALAGKTIAIAESGKLFGYLDVRDAALALAVLIESEPHNWANVYNIGPDESYSLTSLAESIAKIIPGVSTRITVSKDEQQVSSAIDSDKFRTQFDWSPSFNIEDSIQSNIEYELNAKGADHSERGAFLYRAREY